MHLQGLGEGGHGGEQALLKPREDEARLGGVTLAEPSDAPLTQVLVFGEHRRQLQLGRVARQPVDRDGIDDALREGFAQLAQVRLQATDHHGVEFLRLHRDAAREALRVEHLEQRGKAVGVAVVGRGRQEQAVLEASGEVAHGLGELTVDRIALAACGCGVVRLVDDQERTGAELAEHVAETGSVDLVGEQTVGDEEA